MEWRHIHSRTEYSLSRDCSTLHEPQVMCPHFRGITRAVEGTFSSPCAWAVCDIVPAASWEVGVIGRTCAVLQALHFSLSHTLTRTEMRWLLPPYVRGIVHSLSVAHSKAFGSTLYVNECVGLGFVVITRTWCVSHPRTRSSLHLFCSLFVMVLPRVYLHLILTFFLSHTHSDVPALLHVRVLVLVFLSLPVPVSLALFLYL